MNWYLHVELEKRIRQAKRREWIQRNGAYLRSISYLCIGIVVATCMALIVSLYE